jgi:hypothetical protein
MEDNMFEDFSLWIVLGVVGIFLFLIWYSGKKAEEKRVSEILAHQGEWGEEMCQWLIRNRYKLSEPRTMAIMNNFQAWGKETCQKLLQKTIAVGSTAEMVGLSLGRPTSMDEKTLTEKDEKIRWIYGVPRQGATYIWFKNGKVTKIKQ